MRNILTVLVFIIGVIFAACEKMPEPNWGDETTELNTVWTNGTYSLESSLKSVNDTLIGYQGVNAIWAVVNASGTVINGVNFSFGSGGVATGGQVMHAYTATGVYLFTFTIPGIGPESFMVKVLPFGGTTTASVIKQIYHSYSNNLCHDTIGLMVEMTSGWQAPGWYFVSGDFNSWPSPPNALALNQTRIIEGKTYALWVIDHAPGLEKMNFGKNFTGGGYAWNFSPNDLYWHANPSGGELWIYFTPNGISPTPGGAAYPGDWGDTTNTWTFRGSVSSYGTSGATTVLYVNKDKIANPSNPQMVYKLNNNSWVSVPLTDNGNYYSVTISGISYTSLVYFYALGQSGNTSSKVATGSIMYSSTYECCIVQINQGFLKSGIGDEGIYQVQVP